MRHRLTFSVVTVTLLGAAFATALAQPPEGRDGPPRPGRGDGLRDALDTNGDHELDADEIKNASASLAKADKNGDGKIDRDEFRPPMPPIPHGGEGFRGPPPPPDGESEARPGRGRGLRGEGRPPREGGGGGEGPPRAGGPSPERFVERALTFDADGDGKLDKGELEKFAGEMAERMRSAMANRDGAGPRRRPEGSEGEGRPERPRRPE
ncbi:MAG: hypothetical protein K8S94_17165 [Planctomycetia bacterium]|nr:hypothetical protein [Planctomycetia bacterium]